jgi:hypothetical protein
MVAKVIIQWNLLFWIWHKIEFVSAIATFRRFS